MPVEQALPLAMFELVKQAPQKSTLEMSRGHQDLPPGEGALAQEPGCYT